MTASPASLASGLLKFPIDPLVILTKNNVFKMYSNIKNRQIWAICIIFIVYLQASRTLVLKSGRNNSFESMSCVDVLFVKCQGRIWTRRQKMPVCKFSRSGSPLPHNPTLNSAFRKKNISPFKSLLTEVKVSWSAADLNLMESVLVNFQSCPSSHCWNLKLPLRAYYG